MKTQSIFIFLCACFLVLYACKKDDDIDCPDGQVQHGDHCHDEQELITSLYLYFVDGVDTTVFSFKDLDGPAGASPTVDSILINDSASYAVHVEVKNEAETPVEDLTAEILAEKDDHQLFYNVSDVDLTTTYLDQDNNSLPIGLQMSMTSGAASTGTLNVVLKHQPGIKDGNLSTGDTDVDVTFQVKIN